ncbi:MAG: hypothetical protein ACYCZZ_02955 [Minisyncoccota bacterium]
MDRPTVGWAPLRRSGWPLVLVGAASTSAGIVASRLGLGFDVTDEGFYLLSARAPSDVWVSPSEFHVYLGAVYRAVGGSVLAFRLAGLLALLGSTLVLGMTLSRILSASPSQALERIVPVAFLTSGALLYYTWLPATPSYNLIVAICIQLFLAMLLRTRSAFSAWVSGGIAGILVGIVLFTKFPTAIILLAIASFHSIATRRTAPFGARWMLLMAAGIVSWAAFHFTVVTSFDRWIAQVTAGFQALSLSGSGYSIADTARRLRNNARDVLVMSATVAWPALVAGPIARLGGVRPGAREISRRWARLALAAVAPTVLLGAILRGWHSGGMSAAGVAFVPYIPLLAAAASVHALRGRATRCATFDVPAILALLSGTAAMAAGTNNPPQALMIMAMGPFFGAVLGIVGRDRPVRDGLSLTVLVPFAVMSLLQTWTAGRDPYRLAAPMSAQTVHISLDGAENVLRVDRKTAGGLWDLNRVLADCGFRAGGDLIPLAGTPGLVYAAQGRSPATSIYRDGGTAQAYNELILSQVGRSRLSKAFLLLRVQDTAAAIALGSAGLQLGRDFLNCGVFTWPAAGASISVWAPSDVAKASNAGKPVQ